MNLDGYLKKGRSNPDYSKSLPPKTCLNCGAPITEDGTFLSRTRFCNMDCKEEYVSKSTPMDRQY